MNSPKTKKDYLKNLERFRNKSGIENHDEFLNLPPKTIQTVVEDYIMNMTDVDHPNSVPTFYYPIQAFLEMNDVSINFKKMRRLFPQKVKTSVERGWTTEEICTVLHSCPNLRTRAAIHVENTSGGCICVCEDLRIKHIVAINEGNPCSIWKRHDSKTVYKIPGTRRRNRNQRNPKHPQSYPSKGHGNCRY